MGKTPDIFDDLRRVGALKRDRLGGRPSDNALSKVPKPAVSRDTVGAWLRGDRFPQQLEPLRAIVGQIRAEAARQGILQIPVADGADETVADLLAEERWQRAWNAEQQHRTQTNREAVERQKAQIALEQGERQARQAALVDRPRPIRSWTAQRLGVHPAIPGHQASLGNAGFVVPSYVPRTHDAELRAHLATAAADRAAPLLVVVSGESCTGKTRTAFEALRAAVPDDFELVFPADTDSLLAVLAADALAPRTILWLNEAQNYLAGPAGEAAAAALLRRLDAEGPLLVMTTLWPDHDKTLTAPPVGKDDPHRHARKLLAQARRTYLPASFADDLDAVRRAANQDRSLTAALDTGGASITQILAAGPNLVSHYEHPAGGHGVYGRALISAAMDAHRLGITRPLPLAFLEAATPGYLTDSERAAADADWFTEALAHARTLIKHTTRPLQDVPRPSGMGKLPGVVRLADYLQQHGRRTRRLLCPPGAFWDAATGHLTGPDGLTHLGHAARYRHRYRHAAQLYRAAADAGSRDALAALAMMREEARDRVEAERLARQAAFAGNSLALIDLGLTLWGAGERDEAAELYRAAADAGSMDALAVLAMMRERAGDRDEAERLARQAADRMDGFAFAVLAWMRERAGDRDGAAQLYRAAADAGSPYALVELAMMLERAGDRDGAADVYHAAADAGSAHALAALARIRNEPKEAYERYGLEADGSLAKPWAWPTPVQSHTTASDAP
jgi:TPR repeat protein